MKDEEIDEVLSKAARTPHDFDSRSVHVAVERIKSSIGPVRPLPPKRWLVAGLFLACATVAVAAALHAGLFGFEKMALWERSLLFPVLGILAIVAASGFVNEMIPGSLRRVSSRGHLAATIVTLAILFALLFRDYRTDHFFSAGIACLAAGLLYAIPAALLSWLLLRRGFAVNTTAAGLAAGTLAGLAGVGMLELHCPNFQAAHVLVWHIAVVPCSAAASALMARLASFGRNRISSQD